MLAVGTVCVVVCRVIVREQVAVGKEIDCNVEAVVFVAEADTESRICVFADGIELCLSEVDPETDLFVNRGDVTMRLSTIIMAMKSTVKTTEREPYLKRLFLKMFVFDIA